MRSKQAIAVLTIGIVRIIVDIGSASRYMRESEEYADAVSKGFPVVFESITKVANVASGATVRKLLPNNH